MIIYTLRFLAIISLLGLMTACDFHLRKDITINNVDHIKQLAITGKNQLFIEALKQTINLYPIHIFNNADYQLSINKINTQFITNESSNFQHYGSNLAIMSVTYQLKTHDNLILSPPITLNETMNLQSLNNNPYIQHNQKELALSQMQYHIIHKIITRLLALTNKKLNEQKKRAMLVQPISQK